MAEQNDPYKMPTPKSAKPGEDWVSTQDGQGWVPTSHPLAWKAPAGAPTTAPAPGAPTPGTGAPGWNASGTPYNKVQGPVADGSPNQAAVAPGGTPYDKQPGPMADGGPNQAAVATPTNPPTTTPPAPGAPTPPAVTTDGPAGPVTGIPTLEDRQRSAEKAALIQQLMDRAHQSTIIDPNDPNIRGQVDAYSAQAERARRNFLADTAEGTSPYSTGAMLGQERMTAEKMGQDVGGLEVELRARELQTRRTEIQQALDSLGGLLSNEEQQGLQRELANLNAAIEKTRINTQNTQFFAGLNQNDKQFATQIAQNERFQNMDDAFRRMELAQNDSQFMKKLAQEGKLAELDNAFREKQLNQNDSQFLMKLAQDGKFQEMEQEFRRLQLGQDNNQFIAKLAQEGRIAEMDDLFRQMQLMQQQSQFLDRLGFDIEDRRNYWDWLQRGNAPPNP